MNRATAAAACPRGRRMAAHASGTAASAAAAARRKRPPSRARSPQPSRRARQGCRPPPIPSPTTRPRGPPKGRGSASETPPGSTRSCRGRNWPARPKARSTRAPARAAEQRRAPDCRPLPPTRGGSRSSSSAGRQQRRRRRRQRQRRAPAVRLRGRPADGEAEHHAHRHRHHEAGHGARAPGGRNQVADPTGGRGRAHRLADAHPQAGGRAAWRSCRPTRPARSAPPHTATPAASRRLRLQLSAARPSGTPASA